MTRDYIDTGDRIVVTEGAAEVAHARSAKPDLVGKHGRVVSNDGWGLCRVLLDDNTEAMLWNSKDLAREEPT